MAEMTKSSMTMAQAMNKDGILEKMAKKRKMKKAIKSQNKGTQSYKFSPVKKTLKKVGSKIADVVEQARVGSMQRKAMRQQRRTGASDTCDPTKPKSCKTYSPVKTF